MGLFGNKSSKSKVNNVYVQNPNRPQTIAKPQQQTTQLQTKRMLFDIAGMYYCEDALIEAAIENKYYDMDNKDLIASGKKKVYEYFFKGNLVFEEEPTNKYDKNAVRIILNGKHIGYVPAEFAPKMKKIIANHSITKVEYKITGGNYKEVEGNRVEEYETEYRSSVIVTYTE